MRFLIPILFISIHVAKTQHSVLSSALSTSSRAMGQTGICEWIPISGFINPAHLASIESNHTGLDAHNYYYLAGLYNFAAHGALRMTDSGFGLHLVSDGSKELREWLLSIAYGRKLGSKTGIGMSVDYIHTQTPESNDLYNISFELGLQTQLFKDVLVGFVIKNPIPINSASLHPYPVVFKAGFNYRVYEELEVVSEVQKHGDQKTSFHIGLKYKPIKSISLMTGINTQGPTLHLGAGYSIKNNITLCTAFEHHTILGLSSSFGFNYQFR
jgi:hypothetical protein